MATMKPTELGAAVRDARIGQHWNQSDLAARTGVSREWVSKLESGAPRLEHDKVLSVISALGFHILTPTRAAGSELADTSARAETTGRPRRRVSAKERAVAMAAIEKSQQLAGHQPSTDALDRAGRILDGELTLEQARDEIVANLAH